MTRTVKASFMGGEPVSVYKNRTLLELSREHGGEHPHPYLLATVNSRLAELRTCLHEDSTVQFLDATDPNGFRAYQRSLVFVMVYAAKCVLGKKTRVVVEHSISKNYFCEIPDRDVELTEKVLKRIEATMRKLVEQDLPIERHVLPIDVAMKYAAEYGLDDKVNFLQYRHSSGVSFYKLEGFYDYFYGPMVVSTGCLNVFSLHKNGKGFILQFPSYVNPTELSELKIQKKVSQVFKESNQWAKILKVDTVGALNNVICGGGLNEIMLISEALQEKKIAYIADTIYQEKKSIVLIAGPSSSGKTTFANRLTVQLRVNGLKPYILSLDNYFLGRDKVPLDEKGNPDYDSFQFLDAEQLNKDLKRLMKGESVELPSYNFHTGVREYNGKELKLAKGDVLVIEGIHALNEETTISIPKSQKFKIFISALTQLNIDDHNRIPTTDTRLIRRIVRDYLFRGMPAARTISQWPSVGKGEKVNIFPYQEEADAMFNSALVYELCVLKQFIAPLLFQITPDMPQYTEARRLIKFLDCFLGVDSSHIPPNSILREFIGGSCFNV